MTLSKHLAVGGGHGQRGRWHLPHPKVRGQYRASMGDLGSRTESSSSPSVLHHQPCGSHSNQHNCTGDNCTPCVGEMARRYDHT